MLHSFLRWILSLACALAGETLLGAPLPIVDLSNDEARRVVIAQGTPEIYQGHPTTLLLPDGKTMYAVWTLGHGGPCGPMKRSNDGGKTWSELLPVPENWQQTRNCPSLYRLTDPQGVSRLFVFAGQGPGGSMQQSHSTDEGRTWTPMAGTGLTCVMPFCTIVPVDGGKRLLGLTNIRRSSDPKDAKSNIITQSFSEDGGLTWSPWKIILDMGEFKPCEPALVRSPDGKQLLCLLRENSRTQGSLYLTSDDEGTTWTAPKSLPAGLAGDRHMVQQTSDGRLVVCFRDMGRTSPTRTHFVAWVGRYEDLLASREGDYKIKLLHSFAGSDCGYPGLELLPDGTLVATTYVKYREGAEKQSVVSTRFKLAETDALAKAASATAKVEAAPKVAGILIDDAEAELKGPWEASAKQNALVGEAYRHDQRNAKGAATAKFIPEIKQAGRYEVRVLYVANANRAAKVSATVRSADGEKTFSLNQKEECLVDGVPRALGTFQFSAGRESFVLISNEGATGYVTIDGVQFVPEDIAAGERATKAGAGFPTHAPSPEQAKAQEKAATRVPKVPRPAKSLEPVSPVRSASAVEVNGKDYDLAVIGGTPGGIACAVRAAREGLRVLLVNHTAHLGGFVTSGAGGWEAPYDGLRSPLYAEMRTGAENYYREMYGEGSPQHRASLPDPKSNAHIDRPKIEPRVAEILFNRMVERERSLTVLNGYVVETAERDGTRLKSVTLRELHGQRVCRVTATVFADGMYEGDLLAAAGVSSRIGREARTEYQEPHAGVLYTAERHKAPGQRGFPKVADEGSLKIRYNSHATAEILEGPQSGEADGSVMAYNYRLILTRDPANRVMVTKPADYDEAVVKSMLGGGFVPNLPNDKVAWNGGRLIGPQNEYPVGDWATREKISRLYLSGMLGLLWFYQNDPSAPADVREKFQDYGLAADEFTDNGYVPYEIYVREARRLVGRYVFTEHDNKVPAGLGRTPIHRDSIAMTDWPVDSVACLNRKIEGSNKDGVFFLAEESRPAQVPYRSLLAKEVDNLLVPVALSASHVGWGSIRLEPVWMQTGEAAGLAAALAVKSRTTPAGLDADLLIRALATRGATISFFNDVESMSREPSAIAAQYFGTKGFFADYDAQLGAPLKAATARLWIAALPTVGGSAHDSETLAKSIAIAELQSAEPITEAAFAALLPPGKAAPSSDRPITREAALELLFSRLPLIP